MTSPHEVQNDIKLDKAITIYLISLWNMGAFGGEEVRGEREEVGCQRCPVRMHSVWQDRESIHLICEPIKLRTTLAREDTPLDNNDVVMNYHSEYEESMKFRSSWTRGRVIYLSSSRLP